MSHFQKQLLLSILKCLGNSLLAEFDNSIKMLRESSISKFLGCIWSFVRYCTNITHCIINMLRFKVFFLMMAIYIYRKNSKKWLKNKGILYNNKHKERLKCFAMKMSWLEKECRPVSTFPVLLSLTVCCLEL